ncbi:unnamed protein product, partial [Prorocentrum cordatum]
DRALWQGLRVLFQHLEGGDAQDQRRLHRSGALPSLIASLFLQPTFLTGEAPGLPPLEALLGAEGRGGPAARNAPGSPGAPPRASADGRHASDRRLLPPRPSLAERLGRGAEEGSRRRRGTPQEALQDLAAAAARGAPEASSLRALLHGTLAALAVERLLALLASMRRGRRARRATGS